jgi:hypothetical protein
MHAWRGVACTLLVGMALSCARMRPLTDPLRKPALPAPLPPPPRFARRFADRAKTNADAMQRMAGQLAAAAMGRLPPESDGDEGY